MTIKEDIYDKVMKPIEKNGLHNIRKKQVSKAYGNVLELGAGNCANLPLYDFAKIEALIISDMKFSKKLDMIKNHNKNKKISFQQLSVTEIPFRDKTFDTILFTLIFCSVDDVPKGLNEIKRVLKDDGQIIFIEHVIAPKNPLRKIMHFINPAWCKIANDCNLNRDFEKALVHNGFIITEHNHYFNGIGFSGVAKKIIY